MDKKIIIEGLKKLKEGFLNAQKFVDAKLNDGVTIIRYEADKLDIGVEVLAVTEQGAIAIPDGDYTLEDGTTFSIAGGVVSAVTPIEEAPAEEAPSAEPAPAAAMTEAKAKSIIESVIKESRFVTEEVLTEKLAEFTTQKETFEAKKREDNKTVAELQIELASQKETISAMFKLLEVIANEPSAEPAEKQNKAFDFKSWKKEYKQDLSKLSTK